MFAGSTLSDIPMTDGLAPFADSELLHTQFDTNTAVSLQLSQNMNICMTSPDTDEYVTHRDKPVALSDHEPDEQVITHWTSLWHYLILVNMLLTWTSL